MNCGGGGDAGVLDWRPRLGGDFELATSNYIRTGHRSF